MSKSKLVALVAAVGALANAGLAMGASPEIKIPMLTLEADAPSVEDRAAPTTPLMMGLDKLNLAKPLQAAELNIYGWIEAGYTYDHRSQGHNGPVLIGPVRYDNTLGQQNHVMLDQVVLRFERVVKSDRWDVGGLVEVMYGSDAAAIHSNGLSFGNETRTGVGGSPDADDRFNPQLQFDIPQAYIDVNVPVGNGLKLRAGKFYGILGYESNDPRSTPFYSRSYLFNATPYTQTGILGFYTINDQWSVAGGISRGSDQSLEDNNGAIDAIGRIAWTPNKQWSMTLNWSFGPENDHDNSHYRTVIDPIITWQATEKLSFSAEALYMYDGGRNGSAPAATHAYGDVWGAAVYSQYVINEYATANLRLEKYHDFANSFNVSNQVGSGVASVNVYEITLGLSIKPFPKDPIGKNLIIRPETRYDYSEDKVFQAGGGVFRDQWTFAADVIFSF